MTLKKIFAPLAAVALVAVMAVSLISQTGTAHAVVTVPTPITATAALTTNLTNGTQVATTVTAGRLDCVATTDCPAGGVLVITAPAGWKLGLGTITAASGVVTNGGAIGTLIGAAPTATLATDGSSITLTIGGGSTTAGDDLLLAGFTVTPISSSTVTGNLTAGTGTTAVLIPAVNVLGTLTAGAAMPTTGAISVVPAATSISTNGTDITSIAVTLTATGGTAISNSGVTCTSSIGRLGTTATGALTSTVQSATLATSSTGLATFWIRSGGTVGTDTVVCSNSQFQAVGTGTLSMTAGTGNTATKSALLSVTNSAVGATNTTVGTQYVTTTASSTITFLAQDAASAGVNGQVLLISVDKGAVVAGAGTACAGVSAKAVAITTATVGTNSGAAVLTYCPIATETGSVTVTAKNITTTTVADVTAKLTAAGKPAAVTASVANNIITVEVKDGAGNLVADGTPVSFAIAGTAGVVSSVCTVTSGGKATTTVALTGASGNVVVSASFNETGGAPTCAAVGAQQIAITVAVGAGSTPTPTPGTSGSFSGGTIAPAGVSIVSFTGTTAQLTTAGTAAKVVSVSATVNGKMITFVIGAPDFVNAEFNAAFPTGLNGTLVIVKTGA